MRTDKRILAALGLNVAFAVLELIGGLWTGSVAVLSDALHDVGDALSIALSYALEKTSKKAPDDRYTYGYARFSLLGALVTNAVLLAGTVPVVWRAFEKLIAPTPVRCDGMIVLAAVGILVNGGAVLATHKGQSLNQRAVSLHMLEDVCGWVVVLIGAFAMKFTDWLWIDPLLSIGVAVVLGYHAVTSLCAVLRVFLERAPTSVDTAAFGKALAAIDGVQEIHHLHVWSLDGEQMLASMHVVARLQEAACIQEKLRACAEEYGVAHVTIQWEETSACDDRVCNLCRSDGAVRGHSHHAHG